MIGDVKNLAALSPSGPAGALNADMQPAPFQYDFGKMKSTDILAEEQKVIPKLAKAQGDLKAAEIQYEQNLAGEKAKATEKIASDVRDKVTETQKKEAEFPFPEFHPTQENAQSLGELFSLVSTVGLMLGSSGKMASMNALSAMSGMLQGWQKGRADLYKKQKDEFDKEFQRIKNIRENLRKDLMDYMALVPVDKEAAMYKAEEIARKAGGSSIISAYMNKQQPEMALKILDSAGKVIQHKEDMEARARQHRETMASNEKLRLAQIAATLEMKRANLDYKDRDKVLSMTQGVRGIESLMTQLKDPDVKAGLQAKVAPLLEKLTSAGNAEFETAVNNALTGTDKTTLFLKDALLETYAIERAAKGGQRLTVQDMKMVGPVLDPTNYKPETYMELLNQRRKVLYNNLQDMGVQPEQIKKLSAQRPYESFGGSSPAGDIGTQAKEAFGSYEPNKYEYRVNPETGKVQRKQKGQ